MPVRGHLKMIWRPMPPMSQPARSRETKDDYVGMGESASRLPGRLTVPCPNGSAFGPHIGAALADRLQIGIGVQLLDHHHPRCTMFRRVAPKAPHGEPGDNDAANDDQEVLLHCILRLPRKKQEECQIDLT